MQRITVTLAINTSLALPALGAGAGAFDNWKLLETVEITEVINGDRWEAEKTFPDPLRAATEGFRIEGYYLPIEAQGYVSSFLLVRDPADCPFCGGGAYGPSLEVNMKRPIKDRAPYSRITLTGELQLIDDPETYMAYRLIDAAVLR